jgi:hypothetical protein
MADGRETYSESPSFAGFPSFALSFIFAGRLRSGDKDARSRPNVRLAAARAMLKCTRSAAYAQLVQPTQSFFADILVTEVPLQRRPMIFAVETEAAADAERLVTLVRPKELDYVAEGRNVCVTSERPEIELEYRDVFALFESGHLFYVLSLIPRASVATKLNEYHIIALQKLVNPTEETEALRQTLRLRSGDGQERAIVDFVAWRLAELQAADAPTNAVRDIMPSVLLEGESLPSFGWSNLKSLLIAIEDKDLVDQISRRPLADTFVPSLPPRPHMPAGTAPATRRQLALAGLVQGIADFPFQDQSELADSIQPIVAQPDAIVFAHPKFLIEIGPVWRSLVEMRRTAGTCPYVLLTHLVISYNQHLLEEVEGEIERLLYGVEGEPVRARVLAPLQRLVEDVEGGTFGRQKQLLKRNLARRVLIYRDLILSRLPNIFRYPRERDVFERMSASYALEERFEACLQVLKYYDDLSMDVHHLSGLIADRRMNRLLLLISAISAFSILSVTNDLISLQGAAANAINALLIAIWLLLAFGILIFITLRLVLWLLR